MATKSLSQTVRTGASITVRERLRQRYHGTINLTKNLCFIDREGIERPFTDLYEYDEARVRNHHASNSNLRRAKQEMHPEAYIAIEWVIYFLLILALLTPYILGAIKQRFFASCIKRRKAAQKERKLRLEELKRRGKDYSRAIIPIRIPQVRRRFIRKTKVKSELLLNSVPQAPVDQPHTNIVSSSKNQQQDPSYHGDDLTKIPRIVPLKDVNIKTEHSGSKDSVQTVRQQVPQSPVILSSPMHSASPTGFRPPMAPLRAPFRQTHPNRLAPSRPQLASLNSAPNASPQIRPMLVQSQVAGQQNRP